MNCKCCKVPLVWRILIGFILGIVFGLALPKAMGEEALNTALSIVAPFGSVLVSMLKTRAPSASAALPLPLRPVPIW